MMSLITGSGSTTIYCNMLKLMELNGIWYSPSNKGTGWIDPKGREVKPLGSGYLTYVEDD